MLFDEGIIQISVDIKRSEPGIDSRDGADTAVDHFLDRFLGFGGRRVTGIDALS